jgi:glycosyltransferase involved in cell wall biosynthesis
MKPKIWHLIGDKRPGGSNHLVRELIASSLGDRHDFFILRLEEIATLQKSQRPDLIIFHYPCAWKYIFSLLKLKKYAPVYICDHHYCQGFESQQVKSPWRFRLMLKICYRIATGVISVSQAQRRWMLESQLLRPNKVRVIYPASKLANLLTIPSKTPTAPLILAAYGRLAPQKGFEQFLEVIQKFSPQKIQFYLGGYGPEEEQIKKLSTNLPQVHFLGRVENVAEFLARCDAVVIPSRWEPFGLVCLEAKAAGKPVLVSQVDGLVEQVQGCGLVLPLGDQNAWTTAIAALNPEILTQWGRHGRATVIQAWDNCVQEWEWFFREALGE